MASRTIETIEFSPQERAYAIGIWKPYAMGKGGRFHIRRVVWSRILAREEKREGESIRRVRILITGK